MLQYNKFIRSGYRAGLTYPQCLCSMFQLHNETGGQAREGAAPAFNQNSRRYGGWGSLGYYLG